MRPQMHECVGGTARNPKRVTDGGNVPGSILEPKNFAQNDENENLPGIQLPKCPKFLPRFGM